MICHLCLKFSIKLSNLWSKKVIKTFEKIAKNNCLKEVLITLINLHHHHRHRHHHHHHRQHLHPRHRASRDE